MRPPVKRSAEGRGLAREAGETLGRIVGASAKVADIVNEISDATGEQANGIDEMSQAVAHMDEMTQQNAALVEESAAAAESLDAQAHALTEIVARFKTGVEVRRTDISRAKSNGVPHASAPRAAVKPLRAAVKRGPVRPELAASIGSERFLREIQLA